MQQVVYVVAVEGEDAVVQGERQSACSSCAGKSSCSTLGSWSKRVARIRIANELHAEVGDAVVVEVPDGLLLKATFKLYGVPVLMFLLGGMLSMGAAQALNVAEVDAWAAVGALLAAAGSYVWLWKRGQDDTLSARMVSVSKPDLSASICG